MTRPQPARPIRPMAWQRLTLSLTLCLAPAAAALAAGHIVDLQWNPQGRFEHQAEVPAGKFVEICGALKPGQSIGWSFQGEAALNFNIHYHLGKETVYPARLEATREAAQTLEVQAEQVHCWMWSNKSAAPVRVSLALWQKR